MGKILIEAENIVKTYKRGSEEIHALDGVTLKLSEGDFLAFTGPSGSGKTTLVNILGCLDNPTSGTLRVGGEELFSGGKKLSERALTAVRRKYFGYVFQSFYLIPTLTVYENTVLPFTFYKNPGAGESAEDTLKALGLEHRLKHLPGELSGGEMQRVAIARALVNKPRILLADEPTGNLDAKRSEETGLLLKELNKQGLTIIMVTHNLELARAANRQVQMKDGRLQ